MSLNIGLWIICDALTSQNVKNKRRFKNASLKCEAKTTKCRNFGTLYRESVAPLGKKKDASTKCR